MRNTFSRAAAALAMTFVWATAVSVPAQAMPVKPGAAKVGMSDHATLVNCFNGDAYFRSGSEQVRGFVVFNYSTYMNTVRATVSLKGAAHQRYYVKFVQATPSFIGAMVQCLAVDGTLVTNAVGNGTLTIEQPRYSFGGHNAQALQVWLSATEYPMHWWDTDELLAANEPYELPEAVS